MYYHTNQSFYSKKLQNIIIQSDKQKEICLRQKLARRQNKEELFKNPNFYQLSGVEYQNYKYKNPHQSSVSVDKCKLHKFEPLYSVNSSIEQIYLCHKQLQQEVADSTKVDQGRSDKSGDNAIFGQGSGNSEAQQFSNNNKLQLNLARPGSGSKIQYG